VKLGALLLALVAAPAAAQMYKCTNERGVVQYTDKPMAGCKEVDIRPSPPISGALQAPAEDLSKQDAEFRRRQIERERSASAAQQAHAQRCTELRREYSMLATSRRVVRMNEKGEREFMDDAVRERRLADLQRDLSGCP
jgi:hypothetical protein